MAQKLLLQKTIATSFGAGYLPIAPGTFGAIVGFFISVVVWQFQLFHIGFFHIIASLLSLLLGIWAATSLEEIWGHDPSKIVIDETMGFWVSVLFIPISWSTLIAGLILFRFFDIAKPLGIRKFDQMSSPSSVMLDDLLAGIYANIVLQVLVYFTPLYN